MPIRFKCPTCERTLSIARRKAGTRVVCPRCEDDIAVPELEDDGESLPVVGDATGEEVVAEPTETTQAAPKMPAPKPKPLAKPTPAMDKLFEDSDVEALLEPKGKKAEVEERPEPPKMAPRPSPAPDVTEEKGITISRGAAVVLAVLMLVLLSLAFATGYLIGS